jgi:hypothetical protein
MVRIGGRRAAGRGGWRLSGRDTLSIFYSIFIESSLSFSSWWFPFSDLGVRWNVLWSLFVVRRGSGRRNLFRFFTTFLFVLVLFSLISTTVRSHAECVSGLEFDSLFWRNKSFIRAFCAVLLETAANINFWDFWKRVLRGLLWWIWD